MSQRGSQALLTVASTSNGGIIKPPSAGHPQALALSALTQHLWLPPRMKPWPVGALGFWVYRRLARWTGGPPLLRHPSQLADGPSWLQQLMAPATVLGGLDDLMLGKPNACRCLTGMLFVLHGSNLRLIALSLGHLRTYVRKLPFSFCEREGRGCRRLLKPRSAA